MIMSTVLQDAANFATAFSTDELIAECNARAGIYRLLAGVFLEEPTAEYLNAIRSPAVMSSLLEMGVVFPNDFTDPPLAELLDTLACEYAELFVVTGGCPPVESIRLYGRFQQQPYFEVREIYQKAGFRVSGGRFTVFDDQLGVELTFIAELLGRAADALASGNQKGYEQVTKEIKRFWVLHTGKWVRGYASLLGRASDHSFYREMAKLLASFSDWEINLLGLRVDDVDGGKLKIPEAEIKFEFDPDEPVCNACDKGKEEQGKEFQKIDISLIQSRLENKKYDALFVAMG
jgi:TorA maturation chaperone TorD